MAVATANVLSDALRHLESKEADTTASADADEGECVGIESCTPTIRKDKSWALTGPEVGW